MVVCSHPNKPLEEHLCNTWQLAQEIASHFNIATTKNDKTSFILHDVAKGHPAFQALLKTGRGRFEHAAPSAALVLLITHDLIGAEAVRRHHTRIQNIGDIKKYWSEWDLEEDAFPVISKIPVWAGATEVTAKLNLQLQSWQELIPTSEEWENLLWDVVDFYGTQSECYADWLRLRILLSLLVTADRFDAAVGGILDYGLVTDDSKKITEYIATLPVKPLSDWRDKIRVEVVESAEQSITCPGVYTLTLPTGAGKTLTGLQIALEAAQRLDATGIIYVLPFVSLVEQNAGVARKVIDNVQEDHYLSYTKSKSENNTLDPQTKFLELFRYWYEPVVVTTLAKLWDVIYSERVNDTMSFHRLSEAIVILDEPQSIPTKYWFGFGKTLELLSKKLGTIFILMTATQPEIAKGKELAPRRYVFPKVRNRINWISKSMSLNEVAQFINEQGVTEKDSMIVLNTRKSALTMWLEMKKLGLTPLFLSAWVTPRDRLETLRQLKEKERKEKRCLVATQVIEAGVDLDFDLVFRDLGPLDSIIQVAGRCNRNCRPGLGRVYVAEVKDEDNRSYCNIYDKVLLVQTKAVLEQFPCIDDNTCSAVVELYYKNLRNAINATDLWDRISSGCWGDPVPLIEQRAPNDVMLIIDYEGTAEKELNELAESKGNKERYEFWQEYKRLMRRLSLQSVQIPYKYLEEWWFAEAGNIISDDEGYLHEYGPGIWIVRPGGIGKIYKQTIGFIPMDVAELINDAGYKNC